MKFQKSPEAIIREKILRPGVEYCDIRFQEILKTRIDLQGDEVKRSDETFDMGGIVRIFDRGRFGISVFNRIESLETAVNQARQYANHLPEGKLKLKKTDIVEERIPCRLKDNFINVSLAGKVKLFKHYNEILKAHEKIISSRLYYSDSIAKNYFASSEGSFIYEEVPDISLSFTSIAKQNHVIQAAHDGVAASSRGYEIVRGLEKLAEKVAKRSVDLLRAKPVRGGSYNVILDPTLAGTFAHEAFGHLSESDFVSENPKLKEMMTIGKIVGSEILNIIDDGSIKGLRGTHRFDDEGVKTRKNYLIKNGKLAGRLHSRLTSQIMDEELTGNARAVNYKHEPIVRMTNTYIDAGKSKLNDMVREIKNGIIAYDFFGGNTAFELFTFSSAYAYMVRNGKIEELVRDVVLSGNLFETLKNVWAISDVVEWNETGGCGKGGQSGLPTPTGAPYIAIKNVMVGGD